MRFYIIYFVYHNAHVYIYHNTHVYIYFVYVRKNLLYYL